MAIGEDLAKAKQLILGEIGSSVELQLVRSNRYGTAPRPAAAMRVLGVRYACLHPWARKHVRIMHVT